jgi:hypothetical protein
MSDNQKIAFIQYELLTHLKMNKGNRWKEFNAWYDYATSVIDELKQYLINKESDELDRQEATWY